MRIVAGIAKGKRLQKVMGRQIRPTPAKVKEALFSILADKIGGCAFLDLFAGSGAIGIEAKSRGASHVVFVDNSNSAIRLIVANLTYGGFEKGCSVYKRDVFRAIDEFDKKKEVFDIIFLDPPYESNLVDKVLEIINQKNLLKPGGEIIHEHSARRKVQENYGRLKIKRTYRFGDSCLSIYG